MSNAKLVISPDDVQFLRKQSFEIHDKLADAIIVKYPKDGPKQAVMLASAYWTLYDMATRSDYPACVTAEKAMMNFVRQMKIRRRWPTEEEFVGEVSNMEPPFNSGLVKPPSGRGDS